MKVLLLRDVYNLGRAGDVKKVAAGYGRNFLVPQGLAVLATPGAMKNAEHIRDVAAEERSRLNQELGAVAEKIDGLQLVFPMKAGETGRLYGSVTTAMIADAIQTESGAELDRRQIDSQPIKVLGVHSARIRLTIDLVPEISIIVHREGESPESVLEEEIPEEIPTEAFADLQAELDAEERAEEEEQASSAPAMAEVEAEGSVEEETASAPAMAEVGAEGSEEEQASSAPEMAEVEAEGSVEEEEEASGAPAMFEVEAEESMAGMEDGDMDSEAAADGREPSQMLEESGEEEPDSLPDDSSSEA